MTIPSPFRAKNCTRDHEDNVLGSEEALGPLAVQGDQHKHQPLGVERAPAEKEGENNNS